MTYIITFLLQMLNRKILVYTLPAEYLGLNGLFSNILLMLSLAELGVGSAIIYSLYQPLREENFEVVQSLMELYRKVYISIGIIVLVLGGSLTPFLHVFIAKMPQSIANLKIYYLLYVINTGMSYFFAYKRSLVICDQKQYLVTIVETVGKIFLNFGQIIILWKTRNFLYYLILQVISTTGVNCCISVMADRLYPHLKTEKAKPLDAKILQTIKKNVMAMFCHKIGNVIVNATDNLIITKFVSLVATGLYSNYTLITAALNGVVGQVFSSLTASVGNLIAENNPEYDKIIFHRILFLNYWIYAFCSICVCCLINPFIALFFGPQYVLGVLCTIVISVNFYLSGMRKTVIIFKDAAGIFWNDRYKALAESIVNLIFSIPFAIKWGIVGVLVGTTISTLTVAFWIEAYVLYKYHFKRSVKEYFLTQMLYGILTLAVGIVVYYFSRLYYIENFMDLLIMSIICAIVINIFLALCFFKTLNFIFYKEKIKDICKKKS